MCKLVSWVVPVDPYRAGSGEVKGLTICEEHNWRFDAPAAAGDLCPIGRVEKAVEDGLAKIAAATQS